MCAQPHLFVVIICSCISRRVVLRMLCPASQLVCATSSTCRHTSSLVCVSSEAIGGIGVRALWSCDIDPVCLRIARSWKSSTVDHSSSHVFQDIWDTLPLDHRCVLSAHVAELQRPVCSRSGSSRGMRFGMEGPRSMQTCSDT